MPKVILVDSVSVLNYEPIVSECIHQSLLEDISKEESYLRVPTSKLKTIKTLNLLFDYIITKVVKYYWDELSQSRSKMPQAKKVKSNFENLDDIVLSNQIARKIQVSTITSFNYQFFRDISKSQKILELVKNEGYTFYTRTDTFSNFLNKNEFILEKLNIKDEIVVPNLFIPILSINPKNENYEVIFYSNWFSAFLFYRIIHYVLDRTSPKSKIIWKLPHYPVRLSKLNYYLIQILKIVNRGPKPYSKNKNFRLSNKFLTERIFLVDNLDQLDQADRTRLREKLWRLKQVYQDKKTQSILNPKGFSKIKLNFYQIKQYGTKT